MDAGCQACGMIGVKALNDKLALIRSIEERGILVTPRIIKAFLKVDRVNFMPEAIREETYGDYPLPVGNR